MSFIPKYKRGTITGLWTNYWSSRAQTFEDPIEVVGYTENNMVMDMDTERI